MKLSNLLNIARPGILALAIAVAPLAVQAQTGPTPAPDRPTADATRTDNRADDRDTDWGWLGLLGLAGLAGLMRKREVPDRTYAARPADSGASR